MVTVLIRRPCAEIGKVEDFVPVSHRGCTEDAINLVDSVQLELKRTLAPIMKRPVHPGRSMVNVEANLFEESAQRVVTSAKAL